MAIFRGTGGSGNSTDDSIVDAVTEQAGIATTKASEAATSATNAASSASAASSSATTAATKATEATTAKTDAETAETNAQTAQSAAETARDQAQTSATSAATSANTANSAAVQTVAGSNTQVVGVYNNIGSVNTVAGDITNVNTVAGISSDVTTVAADASDIGTVSSNIGNVNNVGNNISNVNSVAGNASNINTVASDGTDIGTVAGNISNVNTVAGISSNVTTVAGLETKMDTVIADASDIGTVAGNINDVSTVAGISSDVTSVADNSSNINSVASNMTAVQGASTNATNAATSASNASDSASAASTSASTASTKATEAAASAALIANLTAATGPAGTNANYNSTTGVLTVPRGDTGATGPQGATGSISSASSLTVDGTVTADGLNVNSGTTNTVATFTSTDAGAGILLTDPTGSSKVEASGANLRVSVDDDAAVANSAIQFRVDGGTKATIDSSGNVGIGVTSPSVKLDVSGTNRIQLRTDDGNPEIRSINPTGNAFKELGLNGLDLRFYTSNTERMRLTSAGNVGIGESNPNVSLVVNGEARVTNLHATSELYLGASALGKLHQSGSNWVFDTYASGAFNERFRISDTGVDVTGTVTADAVVLDHATSYYAVDKTLSSYASNNGVYLNGNEDGWLQLSGDGVNRNTRITLFGDDQASANNMLFHTGGSERLRITSSGNVGIGTSSAGTKLDISTEANKAGLRVTAPNTTNQSFGATFTAGTSSSDYAFNVDNAAGSTLFRIRGDGNTGIGTSAPEHALHIYDAGSNNAGTMKIGGSASSLGLEIAYSQAGNTSGSIFANPTYTNDGAVLKIGVDGDRNPNQLVLDGVGNVLVGKSAVSGSTAGVQIKPAGELSVVRADNHTLILNRKNSDGNIALFQKDGSTVGSIGSASGEVFIGSGDTTLRFFAAGDAVLPRGTGGGQRDGIISLGAGSNRFDDVYATNGTIQTSDRNEKQDIAELSAAEQRVAVAAKGLLRKFRWKSAVEEKGDEARTHFGIIAQDLQDAFTAEGLDAGDYAMFINTTWTDEETGKERSRMGVRYSELLAFIISAI